MVKQFIEIVSNPAVSAVLGAIAGAAGTAIPTYISERRKNSERNRNITNLIKYELKTYLDFLKEIKSKEKANDNIINIPFSDELITKIKQMMPEQSFRPLNYSGLEVETKSSVFDNATLTSLEQVYAMIRNFSVTETKGDDFHFFTFSKKKLNDLINKIEEITTKICK